MSYEAWLADLRQIMKRKYGLDPNDIGTPEHALRSSHASGETPREFAAWYADHYDLIPSTGD